MTYQAACAVANGKAIQHLRRRCGARWGRIEYALAARTLDGLCRKFKLEPEPL